MTVALSAACVPVILSTRTLESVGDRSQEPLEPARVQAAQVLALMTGVEAGFAGGAAAIGALLPLWAAALGASITWLYTTLRPPDQRLV
jgi:hypothetical protein